MTIIFQIICERISTTLLKFDLNQELQEIISHKLLLSPEQHHHVLRAAETQISLPYDRIDEKLKNAFRNVIQEWRKENPEAIILEL